MNNPNKLHLTVKKKWFDQILAGTKTSEFWAYFLVTNKTNIIKKI